MRTLLLLVLLPVLCAAFVNSGVFRPVSYSNQKPVVLNRPVEFQREEPTRVVTDNSKPFFVVSAPESSGNRYVVRLLQASGCYGQSDHRQPFDRRGDWDHISRVGLREDAQCYVMHRSAPHAKHWTDLRKLAGSIAEAGLKPVFVTVHRNTTFVAASQLREKHVRSIAQAQQNIAQATQRLGEHYEWARSEGLQVVELEFARMGDADYMQRTLYGPIGRRAPPRNAKTDFSNPDRAKSVAKAPEEIKYTEAQQAFYILVTSRICAVATELAAAAPPPSELDVGRGIAALDALHQAHSAFVHGMTLAALSKKN